MQHHQGGRRGHRARRRKTAGRRGEKPVASAWQRYPGGIAPRHRQTCCYSQEASMNWDRIEGNWKQFKGKIKEEWGKLTDDELDVIAGKRDKVAGKIQERYGLSKDEAEKQLAAFEARHRD